MFGGFESSCIGRAQRGIYFIGNLEKIIKLCKLECWLKY